MTGLFSAAETSLAALDRVRLRERLEAHEPGARLLHALLSQPQRLLSTIWLGYTLAIVSVAVLGTSVTFRFLEGSRGAYWFSFGGVALAVLLLGQVVPKSLAVARPEAMAMAVAGPMHAFMALFRPLTALLTPLTRLLDPSETSGDTRYTEAQLRLLLEMGREQGAIEHEETDLVHSALDFDDTSVDSILTPRVDIVALPVTANEEEALALIASEGYSRMPVYGESIDDVLGVVTARDLLLAIARQEPFDLRRFLRSVAFVPQNKRLNDLLRELQVRETQMAIVSDEYGGTAGLVTVEDILEQIVGDIRDESDEEAVVVHRLSEEAAIVDSMASLEEVNEALGLSLSSEAYQTIGGLVIGQLGRVAKVGDLVELPEARITVKAIKGRRVRQVLIEVARPAPVPAPAGTHSLPAVED